MSYPSPPPYQAQEPGIIDAQYPKQPPPVSQMPQYGAPPPIPVYIQPATIIQPAVTFLGSGPQTVVCPSCQRQVVTLVRYEVGTATWLIALLIFLFGGFLGCCLIPFYNTYIVSSEKDFFADTDDILLMVYSSYTTVNPYRRSIPVRRYQIRERRLSFGDTFKIRDESGRDAYTVRSKIASIGDKLILADMFGNDLMTIRQKLAHFHANFKISSTRPYDFGQELAVAKKKFGFLHDRFKIHSVYGDYSLEGLDILSHSFALIKNGRKVASINKKYFAFSDTYDVEVDGNEDQPFVLALVIVVDQVLYDKHIYKQH